TIHWSSRSSSTRCASTPRARAMRCSGRSTSASASPPERSPTSCGERSPRANPPSLRPAHLVQAETVREALQRRAPAVDEGETLAGGELADDVGDEDLAGPRMGGDPRRGLHGAAEKVLALRDRLARIETDAHPDRGVGLVRVVSRDSLLHGDGALDGARSRPERGHDAVAGVLDLGA